MVDKASLDKINADPKAKAQFLKDLNNVFVQHGVNSPALQQAINAGAATRLNPVASTVAITITQ